MKYLVIGAGKSGVGAANFLAQRGESVVLSDSNPQPDMPYTLNGSVESRFGSQDDKLLDGIGSVVLSPGVPANIPLLR